MKFLRPGQRILLGAAAVAAFAGILYFTGRKIAVEHASAAAAADIVPADVGWLVIRNDGPEIVRGRVRSGTTTLVFMVPEGEVREMQLDAGPARIVVESDPPADRQVVIRRGRTEEVVIGGRG
jgi:hypothetical protein